MKTVCKRLVLVTFLVGAAFNQNGRAVAAPAASIGSAGFTPTVLRAHETVWARAVRVPTPDGRLRWETNSYIEIASGLNRLNAETGEYEPADSRTPDIGVLKMSAFPL